MNCSRFNRRARQRVCVSRYALRSRPTSWKWLFIISFIIALGISYYAVTTDDMRPLGTAQASVPASPVLILRACSLCKGNGILVGETAFKTNAALRAISAANDLKNIGKPLPQECINDHMFKVYMINRERGRLQDALIGEQQINCPSCLGSGIERPNSKVKEFLGIMNRLESQIH